MTVEIRVPTLGESVTEATVARWLKQPGERVDRDEPVVELETDKVTLEVPAPAAGPPPPERGERKRRGPVHPPPRTGGGGGGGGSRGGGGGAATVLDRTGP